MMIPSRTLSIGLTGPFGSGCTTAADILRSRLRYKHFRLSELIKERWKKEHPDQDSTRADLQALGNSMRREAQNPGALAQQAIKMLENDKDQHERIVFDGIRNLGEIETLQDKFGQRFFLFALECPLVVLRVDVTGIWCGMTRSYSSARQEAAVLSVERS